jgi:predicted acyl esterase
MTMPRVADAPAEIGPEWAAVLDGSARTEPRYASSAIQLETVWVTMRDGIRLATDVYLPPGGTRRPTIAVRTPYGRREGVGEAIAELMRTLARHGYAGVVQDVRATGDSEPDTWDMYVYEREDSYDTVDWLTHQAWHNGVIGGAGGSYLAGTQWCMATHPAMTAIAPEVGSPGNGRSHGVKWHMFMNAYTRSVGKGADKVAVDMWEMERLMVDETLATGYFNEPLFRAMPGEIVARYPALGSRPLSAAQRWLWQHYCASPPAERAEILRLSVGARQVTYEGLEAIPPIFGYRVHPDLHMNPFPTNRATYRAVRAPALIINGWYDWGLDLSLQTWEQMKRHGRKSVRDRSRMLIGPSSHMTAGYREGDDPTLLRTFRGLDNVELLLHWYGSFQAGKDAAGSLPPVTYYLMGANTWSSASDWPPPGMRLQPLYLSSGGRLSSAPPGPGEPDVYVYDPTDPAPTLGGSIVSSVYQPGSVDVSETQRRPDVAVYTTAPLAGAVDIAGPLRVVLYASSSARDTDFVARLSDVFPDGRAIQIQNGIVRARYRKPQRPALLNPGVVYEFEIDVWGTAYRFAAGHAIRLDISSSDFPRFERHTNLAGEPGTSIPARQILHHSPEYPSHILLPVLEGRLG